MKTSSKTITHSLIAASLLLSSVSASGATLLSGDTSHSAMDRQESVTLSTDVMESISKGTEELRLALLSGAKAHEKLKLQSALADALKKENVALKFQHAVFKAKEATHQAEKKSFWEGVKTWFSKIDGTKVVTSIISGIVTIIGTILLIIL
jgi:hypothetical protein